MPEYNNQSWSRMWDGIIPTEGSHFHVWNENCHISDERKCEAEGGIGLSNIDYGLYCYVINGHVMSDAWITHGWVYHIKYSCYTCTIM